MAVTNETLQSHTYESTSRRAEVGGLTLHYHDAGVGEPVVMLHGAGPGVGGWTNFKQNLEYFADRYRVLLIDQPGFGQSDKPETYAEPWWKGTARALAELLDALDLRVVHLVGNSLGGGTALRFALDYPDRVGKLVLMGPGGLLPPFSPEPTEGIKKLAASFDLPPNREALHDFIQLLVYDQALVSDELMEERWEHCDLDTFNGSIRALTALGQGEPRELWREVDQIEHPTLLIWGREDRVIPLDSALWGLKQMPNARLYVVPNCGHWVQLEHRNEFNTVVTQFIAGGSK